MSMNLVLEDFENENELINEKSDKEILNKTPIILYEGKIIIY